jgi:hypothetical protein
LQPVWSPDGSKIAYSTDRGKETDLDSYKFGSLNIRILDVETGEAEMIKIGEGIKHINPHFSGDGKNLFFISNPDGFSNIYRYNFDEDRFYQLTNIATGITGITKTSSAMSVSAKTGQIVFSVFDNTEYKIHSLNRSETEGTQFNIFNVDQYLAGVSLPPVRTALTGLVENYLSNYEITDTNEREMPTTDYDPSLSLILAGNTSIGVSVDGYGTGIGGAVSLLFSDLLGNHLLGVTAIANGSYKDIGGQVVYQNLENRYNYGASIAHIPYLTGFVSSSIVSVDVNGQSVLAQELEFFRQRTFVDRLDLLSEYPLSTNRRFEFSVGYSRISYDLEVQRIITDLNGFVISSETKDLDSPSGLNLFRANAAYVGDYSYFGFTSPVDGSRYRFGVEPTFGSLQFLTAVGDYRQYLFFRPITLGFRLLHIGRYFGDSESNRLSPLTIGYDTWVRGYDINSINATEFSLAGDPNQSGNLKSLVGSKIGVFNFEVRLPVIGNEQFGLINLPFLPIELVGFLDAGIAWTKDEPPVFKFEETTKERVPVFSTGIATRINVLGYIVAQVYYAYPFQRPGQGGQFGFLIAPGW